MVILPDVQRKDISERSSLAFRRQKTANLWIPFLLRGICFVKYFSLLVTIVSAFYGSVTFSLQYRSPSRGIDPGTPKGRGPQRAGGVSRSWRSSSGQEQFGNTGRIILSIVCGGKYITSVSCWVEPTVVPVEVTQSKLSASTVLRSYGKPLLP